MHRTWLMRRRATVLTGMVLVGLLSGCPLGPGGDDSAPGGPLVDTSDASGGDGTSRSDSSGGDAPESDAVTGDCDTPLPFYRDSDADGYGRTSSTVNACESPDGYVARAGDCDDSTRAVHPEADEVCNGVDDDCDGRTDEGLTRKCARQKGVCAGSSVACSEATYPTCGSAQYGSDYEASESSCDGKDNDCDGVTDPKSAGCGPAAVRWTRLIGGTGWDRTRGVAVDGRGGLYIVGETHEGIGTGTFHGGYRDGWIAKYDVSGTREWVRLIGTAGDDRALDVAVDGNGEIHVAGETSRGIAGQSHSGGTMDGFVVTYDASGTRTRVRLVGSDGFDRVVGLAANASGAVYAVGQTSRGLNGRKFGGGRNDGFVVKYDASGAVAWTRLVSSAGDESAESVALGAGGVHVGGWTGGLIGGATYNGGKYDGFLVSFDPAGTMKRARLLGSTGADGVYGVAAGSGALYVAGTTDTGFGGGTYNGGLNDGFLAKFDGNGSREWVRLIGSSQTDEADEVAVGPGGGIFVVGEAQGAIGGSNYNGGPNDGFLGRYDAAGSRKWIRLVGTSGYDRLSDLASGGGALYPGGWTSKGLGGRSYSGGAFDGFAAKMR